MDKRHRMVRRGLLAGAAVAAAAALAAGAVADGAPAEPTAQPSVIAPQPVLSPIEAWPVTGGGPSIRRAAAPAPAETADPATVPDPIAEAVTAQAAADSAAPAAFDPAAYKPGASLHTREVLALVVAHFPADQVGNAMAISRCESGHANAIGSANSNGTRDWGVFQLNDGGTLQAALRRIGTPFASTFEAQQIALDAETNVKAARAIFDSRGWAPWTCAYKTGIVAALYSRAPGPMDGHYDERGLAGTVDLNRTTPAKDTAMPAPAVPSPATVPAPAPTPTTVPVPPAQPTPTPQPTPAEQTNSPSPAATAVPTPTDTASAPPSQTPPAPPTG